MSELNILIGKNAIDNWKIYKESGPTDTIFHLDKFPSPYVIANKPIADLTTEQINEAAILCKSRSKYKNMGKIGVMYTAKSNTVLGDIVGEFVVKSNKRKFLVNI